MRIQSNSANPLLTLVIIFGFQLAEAQDSTTPRDNTPKFSNEFLNIGVSAKAFALGLSMVSHTDDVTAAYWNPAGLNQMESDFQLGLMHSDYFGGLANYDYGGFAASLQDDSKLALSVVRFSVDNIPDTRFLFDANGAIDYSQIRFFSATDYAFLLTYARELPILGGIRVGGNTKIIHRMAGSFAKSWGFGIDLGAQKTWKGWDFGLMAKDIFGTFNAWSHQPDELEDVYNLTGNEVPTNSLEVTLPRLILGASRRFEVFKFFSIMPTVDLDMTFDGRRNTLVRSDALSIDPHGGVELGFKDLAFLRFGVNNIQQLKDFDRSTYWSMQPNAGVGVVIKQLHIDYALTDLGDASEALFSHVFSLKVNFNLEDK
ncbi:MAG: hypothetical protein AAGA85_25315 [Bacteroidota bacterium]